MVYVDNTSQINFTNSTVSFNSNTANFYSGVAYIYSGQMSFTNSSVSFNSNISNASPGGVAYVDNTSQINFTNSSVSFNSNISNASPGGVAYVDNSGQMSFTNSTVSFNANISSQDGGAIYISNNSQINFNNSIVTFNENTSSNNGGGVIYATNYGQIRFNNSIVNFYRNKANNAFGAGAIRVNNSEMIFEKSTAIFNSNYTTNNFGGAIIIGGIGKVSFSSSNAIFIDNSAQSKGGAIYMQGGSLYLESGEFSGNQANGQPNDIHMEFSANIKINPKSGKSMILGGGITSENGSNNIEKAGLGALVLKDNVKVEIDGKIDILEGTLELDGVNSLVIAPEINIGNGTKLGITVDFVNIEASSITADIMNIGTKIKLLVNNLGGDLVEGSSVPFIYAGNTQLAIFEIENITRVNYAYSFAWETDPNTNWSIGYLTYLNSIIPPTPPQPQGSAYSFYANLKTLGSKIEPIEDINGVYLGYTQNEKNQRIWASFSLSGLNYDGNQTIGKYTMQSNGIKVGAGIIRGGGIYVGYKTIKAEQVAAKANVGI